MANDVKVDLRVKRTRHFLIQAFEALLEEKGLQALTVRDITERAMVNRSTFYDHFDDKYDLFGYIIRESFAAKICGSLPDQATFNLENLRLLSIAALEYIGQIPGRCSGPSRVDFRSVVETQVQQQLYLLILDWLQSTDEAAWIVKLDVVAVAVSWAIFGTGLQLGHQMDQADIEAIADQVVLLIAKGLEDSYNGPL
ncbi:MAG: TetR/AcrR family transcriptional regulator [Chloroflexota bacterium]